MENNLEILPVINKVDLPNARPDEIAHEIEDVIGLEAMDAPRISAKSGLNVEAVLEEIVKKVPAPTGDENKPLKALIFDSFYDNYRGAISYVRLKEGKVKVGDTILMMSTGKTFTVTEVGYFRPGSYIPADVLKAGQVGYIAASVKNVSDTRVGDTITNADYKTDAPLEGYKKAVPMVFCGVYPVDGADYENLKMALEKLQLNDAALLFEPETSIALGFGFRCGFLGLLHLEIVQERLEREYNLNLITTAPSVIYRVTKTDGEVVMVSNPTNLPAPQEIDFMEEPMVKASIMLPKEFVGIIMDLCQDRRGNYLNMQYLDETRVTLIYELPLNEIIYDFFDALKSRTKGYASFDYELIGYNRSKLVKLDITS